jgi:hypothetical protein
VCAFQNQENVIKNASLNKAIAVIQLNVAVALKIRDTIIQRKAFIQPTPLYLTLYLKEI